MKEKKELLHGYMALFSGSISQLTFLMCRILLRTLKLLISHIEMLIIQPNTINKLQRVKKAPNMPLGHRLLLLISPKARKSESPKEKQFGLTDFSDFLTMPPVLPLPVLYNFFR